jgi:GxxExxY protein
MNAELTDLEVRDMCDRIRQTAYEVHLYLGHGHLEKVYENALANRLRKLGLDVRRQEQLTVFDEDGTVIGDYYADLLVNGWLIVELKAAKTIASEHVAQVLGYLRAARLRHGLLINFGAFKFEIRKFAL